MWQVQQMEDYLIEYLEQLNLRSEGETDFNQTRDMVGFAGMIRKFLSCGSRPETNYPATNYTIPRPFFPRHREETPTQLEVDLRKIADVTQHTWYKMAWTKFLKLKYVGLPE